MARALLLLLAFIFVSPVIRRHVLDVYKAIDNLVAVNTSTAFILTGVLGFSSFLLIRLTARR
jgi:hypothetical protein